MVRKKLAMLAVVAIALVRWTTPAAGQLMQCAGDRERFCGDVPPGGGRLMVCLRQHAADLSPGCRHALGLTEKKPASAESGAATACREDAMKLCSSAVGNKAKMKSCLQAHAAELSDGCKTALIQQQK